VSITISAGSILLSASGQMSINLKELTENFDLFLRQRAPNATVSHFQPFEALGTSFCIASTFASGVALT